MVFFEHSCVCPERTEEVINSRPKSMLGTAKQLVTGNVADLATNISNEQLAKGLDFIEKFIKDPNKNSNFDEIAEFHNELPSSAYKTVINRIYTAFLFIALTTATMFFPPLAPFTAPILGGIALSAGALVMNAITGMAVHRSLKATVELTNQSLYESKRMELLINLRTLDPENTKRILLEKKLAEIEKPRRDNEKAKLEISELNKKTNLNVEQQQRLELLKLVYDPEQLKAKKNEVTIKMGLYEDKTRTNQILTNEEQIKYDQLKKENDILKNIHSEINNLPAINVLNNAFNSTEEILKQNINTRINEATKSYKEKGTLNNNLGFSRPMSSVLAYLGFGAFVDKMDALAVTHPQTVRNFKIAMTIAIPAILGMAALKLPGFFLTTLCNVSTGLVASLGYEKLGVEKIEKSMSNTTNTWKQKFQDVQEKSPEKEKVNLELRSSIIGNN